ncbi:MAG: beta-lactamase family protein [Planctomycetaceae bacterium]|nr:beta-lactamase family protein [Planctomycetaceae bacterium]
MNIEKRQIGWACFIVVLALTCPSLGQDLPTAKPEDVGVSSAKVEELSKFMQSLVDDGKIAGGVTMMARHGKVIHLKAVGMADREEKKPMRTDSIFRIASMTKPITSVAIMMLWEQGKLGLDDPVSKYIPEFKEMKVLVSVDPLETRPAKREITIRHLLTHTSGLTYGSSLKPVYDKHGISGGLSTSEVNLAQMMKTLAGLPILFDPGDKFEYGMSTDVLGRVIEVVSGMTLDRFFDDKILKPLGMNDTGFHVSQDKVGRLASVYIPGEGGIRKLAGGEIGPGNLTSDYPYSKSHKYLAGGGGLCSTPSDYMRFCQMLLSGGAWNGVRLLRPETIKMMTANQIGDMKLADVDVIDRFGFGFSVYSSDQRHHEQLRGAYAWFGHWSTSFRISPHGDWVLVTMTQLVWDEKATPVWFAQYEKIAAEAIQD